MARWWQDRGILIYADLNVSAKFYDYNLLGIPQGWNAFIADHGMLIAAAVFIIASITDCLDGKIARKYNLITNLGKFLDSLADKVLVIAVFIAFVALGRVSAWLLTIIILREFMVTGIRMMAATEGNVMAAKMIGKVKTVTQMIALIYLLFEPTILKIFKMDHVYPLETSPVTVVGDVLVIICVAMTVISGIDYLVKNINYLKEK